MVWYAMVLKVIFIMKIEKRRKKISKMICRQLPAMESARTEGISMYGFDLLSIDVQHILNGREEDVKNERKKLTQSVHEFS